MSSDSPASILFDENGNPVGVQQDNTIYRLQTENIVRHVIPTVSILNSTTTPLLAGAIFTGASEDVSGFVSIDITVLSDVASANEGLLFQWSQDNINWNYPESFTILAGVGAFYSLASRAKYFRLSYTNDGQNQTSFALSTVYYPISRSVYVQNLDTDVPAQKATDVVRSVIAAQKQGSLNNTYANLQATTGAILKVSLDTQIIPPISPILVQSNNVGPITGTSFIDTFATDTVRGNALIVLVLQGQGTAGATYDISDSQGNIYTLGGTVEDPGAGQIDLWTAISNGGSCTFVATNFSQVSTVVIQHYELSGIVSPITDNLNINVSSGTSLTSGSIYSNNTSQFIISAFAASGTVSITPGVGWSSDLSAPSFECESQIHVLSGNVTGTAIAATPVAYAALIASFLPNSGSTPLLTNTGGNLLTSTEITDGYNGPVTVKAPFTAAVSADQALVVALSPNNPITIMTARPTTSITTSVAASTSNVTLLTSNSIRLGATIYNDSNALLYIKLGTGSSTTSYTIKLFPLGYFPVPFGWSGEIDGIWTIAFGSISGFARISELSP
jgi:hypothetical protein